MQIDNARKALPRLRKTFYNTLSSISVAYYPRSHYMLEWPLSDPL